MLDSEIELCNNIGSEDACVNAIPSSCGNVEEGGQRQVACLECAKFGISEESFISVPSSMPVTVCEVRRT